jgi:hypothetical protein
MQPKLHTMEEVKADVSDMKSLLEKFVAQSLQNAA